jgi:hypothetical protein
MRITVTGVIAIRVLLSLCPIAPQKVLLCGKCQHIFQTKKRLTAWSNEWTATLAKTTPPKAYAICANAPCVWAGSSPVTGAGEDVV